MISKQPIKSVADAARYHDKSFNQDSGQKADNYYVNEKVTAHWQGRGAEILGKRGEAVERQDFVDFLGGKLRNPDTGELEDLARNSKGENRRPGLDFTVAPPKSVSIAGLVGRDDRIIEAHIAANSRAMAWFEKHAAIIRVKDESGGNRYEQAGNLLYATVLHETNRENEPHIHSHNVIVSAVYDEKRKQWRSLTNDTLLKLRAQGDVIYKAELVQSLRRLGYEIEHAANGVDFEIRGFTAEQLGTYSSRRAQIRQALVERGIEPGDASFDARQTAALDSRSAKQEFPRDVLQSVWQVTGHQAGLSVEAIVSAALARTGQTLTPSGRGGARQTAATRVQQTVIAGGPALQPHLQHGQDRAGRAALRAVSWAIEHLAEREQSFRLSDLETTAVKFSRGAIDDVDLAIAEHIRNHRLVEREPGEDGASMYTTPRAIDSELRLARNIHEGMGKGNVILADEAEFTAALKAFEAKKSLETGTTFELSGEQVRAARNVLMHADTYQGVQGEAGTGKTAALAMVNDVATAKGWEVVGVATSAAAAKELEASSGIRSNTVAGYFAARDTRIRATELRIDELRGAMNASTRLRHSSAPRLESHRLDVQGADIDYGRHRYTFDHQRGDVFRSPDDFRNAVGTLLTNVANQHRDGVARASADANSFGARAWAGTLVKGVEIAGSIGRRLTTFEQVGTVEALAARNTLYLSRDSTRDQLKHEFEKKQAELTNLRRFGNAEGRKTLLVMDESSLTGMYDTEKLSTLAREIGARVVLQGDTKQHRSVASGRAFEQAQQAGINLSVLEETRRFDMATVQTKQALLDIKAGRYGDAIGRLDTREVGDADLAQEVAVRYLTNIEELKALGKESPQVGIVAVTNRDRKAINEEIHNLLAQEGIISSQGFSKDHLDVPSLTEAEQRQAVMLSRENVDRLVFRKTYREIGIEQGDVVRVTRYDVAANRVYAIDARGQEVVINPQRQDFFTPAKLEDRIYSVGDLVETRAIISFDDRATPKIRNGTRGVVIAIGDEGATIRWNREGTESQLDNGQLRFLDHSYSHTSYKEQGATNDREIIAVSRVGAKVFNKLAAYVAASRARYNTEIVTSDLKTMRKNAGSDVEKTTAVDIQDRRVQDNRHSAQQMTRAPAQAHENMPTGSQTAPEKFRDKGHVLEL